MHQFKYSSSPTCTQGNVFKNVYYNIDYNKSTKKKEVNEGPKAREVGMQWRSQVEGKTGWGEQGGGLRRKTSEVQHRRGVNTLHVYQ